MESAHIGPLTPLTPCREQAFSSRRTHEADPCCLPPPRIKPTCDSQGRRLEIHWRTQLVRRSCLPSRRLHLTFPTSTPAAWSLLLVDHANDTPGMKSLKRELGLVMPIRGGTMGDVAIDVEQQMGAMTPFKRSLANIASLIVIGGKYPLVSSKPCADFLGLDLHSVTLSQYIDHGYLLSRSIRDRLRCGLALTAQ